MINYLNSTKRLFVALTTTTALAGSLSLVSCQDYDAMDEEKLAQISYDAAFVKEFSKIDPLHTWGFGGVPMATKPAQTRGTVDDRNLWESYYHLEVPGHLETTENEYWGWTTGDITQYERAYVYWWFSTHKNPVSLDLNWSDYFIQHVWGQPEHGSLYADGTGYNTNMGMENLHSYEPQNNGIGNSDGDYTHIKDFNKAGGAKEQMDYLTNSTTLDFYYEGSADNGIYGKGNEHVLVCINGNYYLAFDFKALTNNTLRSGTESRANHPIQCDGYYNDWILKLTPGLRKESDGYTRRIMCEDLTRFDNDFNDVVFDATFLTTDETTGKGKVIITLQAAGGTLPVYIGKKADKYEAHNLFKVAQNVPVNVKEVSEGGTQRPAAIFYLEDEVQGYKEGDKWVYNPISIPIYVENETNAVTILASEIGRAPQKFACPNGIRWSYELTPIHQYGYKHFADWVGADNEWKDRWYNTDVNPANRLYSNPGELTASQTYIPNANWPINDIKEWKWLFDHRADTETWRTQEEADKAQAVFTSIVGDNLVSFDSQKPYIYYNPSDESQDLEVRSPYVMQGVLSGSSNIYAGMSVDKTWNGPVPQHRVSLTAVGYGNVSGEGSYDEGSRVQIIATPNDGYIFTSWSDNNTENPRYITVDRDINLSASFEAEPEPIYDVDDLSGSGYTQLINEGNSNGLSWNINLENASSVEFVIVKKTATNISAGLFASNNAHYFGPEDKVLDYQEEIEKQNRKGNRIFTVSNEADIEKLKNKQYINYYIPGVNNRYDVFIEEIWYKINN